MARRAGLAGSRVPVLWSRERARRRQESLPIDDRAIDLARGDKLAGGIERLDDERQATTADAGRRAGDNVDAVADRGRASVLDPDGRADRGVTVVSVTLTVLHAR